jgi:ribosomal protein S18 acetylase RimI-like enzyme
MTTLVTMPAERFDGWAAETNADYAADNVTAGRWPRRGAVERAHAEFRHLLPQGRQTPGHFFYEIREGSSEEAVGSLWFAVVGEGEARSGYVYNVRVQPAWRGRGHARAALLEVERIAAGMGLTAIALHVFGFNAPAQALYRSLGYGITGFNMRKPLRTGAEED